MKFCVSLTTIPPRFDNLEKTLISLQSQELKPDEIFLNIPNVYKRFKEKIADEEIERLKKKFKIKVNRCLDYGPATKLIGSMNYLSNYEYVIILDDDHYYHKKMFDIFQKAYLEKKSNYSFYVQKIFDLSMGQGADGILISTDSLDNIIEYYEKYISKNKNLFLNDDLAISIYLDFIKNKKILDLSDRFKKETNKNLVYDIHSSNNSLKNLMTKKFLNRRKIAKIEIIKFKINNYLKRAIQSLTTSSK